jgi:hypothetical protein
MPWCAAVATSKLPIAGSGLFACATKRPHQSATAASMGKTRPSKKAGNSVSSQSSRAKRRADLGMASIPLRISPTVSTLK